jgi:glycosyltransferase involved in cell wall biosynthesis
MTASPIQYSAVIPVFESATQIGETIARTAAFFEGAGLAYELICVNDGSRDGSWEVLSRIAGERPSVVAIDLDRNYGQHTALLCGLEHSRGEFVVTLDDDLQNPPEEIARLIEKAREGHDLVFGRFRDKRHPAWRVLGSRLVGKLNQWLFRKPRDLVLSNFRLLRRDVVERLCARSPRRPYITGLALRVAASPANAWVEHRAPQAPSRYGAIRLSQLVGRIVINRFAARAGGRPVYAVREIVRGP